MNLNDYVEANHQPEHRERGHLYMSQAGMCLRKAWGEVNAPDEQRPLTAGEIITFADGQLHEGDIIGWIERRGSVIYTDPEDYLARTNLDELDRRWENEEDLSGQFRITMPSSHGKIDGIVEIDDRLHIAEFKSVSDRSFRFLLKNGGVRDGHWSAYCQIQMYLLYRNLLEEEWGFTLESSCYYVAKCKQRVVGEGSFYEEMVEFDPEVAAWIWGWEEDKALLLTSTRPPEPFYLVKDGVQRHDPRSKSQSDALCRDEYCRLRAWCLRQDGGQ